MIQRSWPASFVLPREKALVAGIVGCVALGSSLYLRPADVQLASALLAFALSWASLVDIDRRTLPDFITIGLMCAGLFMAFSSDQPDFVARAGGAFAGFGSIFGIAALYRHARKRDGIGLGDAKLFAAAGAWLGWAELPFVMLIAAIGALIFIGLSAAVNRSLRYSQPVAFGPFLAIGIWIAWISTSS